MSAEPDFADAYVAQWERVATVRRAPRYVVLDGVAPATLYPDQSKSIAIS